MRLLAASAFALSVGWAPLQCTRSPDPSMRREDNAGEALWALARDFQDHHNEPAAQATLRFLVEKYPSNRHAPEARRLLSRDAGVE